MKANAIIAGWFLTSVIAIFAGETRFVHGQDADKLKELKGLFDQGIALSKQGKHNDAVPFMEKAAVLAPKVFGPDHLNTAAILHSAGSVSQSAGRLDDAEMHYRRCLEIRDAKLPSDDLRVADTLNNLGLVLDKLGRFQEAEKTLKRCWDIRVAKLPKNDLKLAVTSHNLAGVYQRLGKYADAELYFKKCLQIRENLPSKDQTEIATTLNNLADLCRVMHRFKEAETLAQRSLQIRETSLGKQHLDVSYSCNELGLIYQDLARYSEAESLYRRALEIREKQLGKNHPLVATSLTNLAQTCARTNRLGEAELMARRALAIREAAHGPNHHSLASVLNNLATFIRHTGRDEEMERLLLRSLTIGEAKLGKDHPELTSTLNNLAGHYSDTRRYKDAEQLYRRALAIDEAHFGKEDHVHVATTLNNLAVLCMRTKRLPEAESLLLRCLRIHETRLDKDHDKVSATYGNLASIYHKQKNFDKADDHYERSIKILETKLGKNNSEIGFVLQDRADLNQAANRSAQALQLQERCLETHVAQLRDVFAFGSEATMLDYVESRRAFLHYMVNMAHQSNADPAAAEAALTWTLRLKGAVFDTLFSYRQLQLSLPQDDALNERVAKYRSQKELLANAALGSPAGVNDEKAKKELTLARQELEDLEKELNRSIAAKWPNLFAEREKTTTAQVRERLTADSVLVEFFHSPVRDFKRGYWYHHHYFAFVLTPGKDAPKLIDLGLAKDIDAGVEALRKEFTSFQEKLAECESADEVRALEKTQEKQFKVKSAALHAKLMAPLTKAIGNAKVLHIAADGALNRLPFECLVDADGKYLVERHRCAYLSSGRDLLRTPGKLAKGTVVFAGPDFKVEASERLAQAEKLLNKKGPVLALRNLPGRDLRSVGFKPLPGAAAEAKDIEKALANSDYGPVKTYVGAQALEEVLKAMPAPRVLHLATHGFFLDRDVSTLDEIDDADAGAGSARRRLKKLENPLLRSGIVLAGANTIGDKDAPTKAEDGWVTAEEIAMLNLHGTELVVLSACQTGLGDFKTGEGVYGLRRAFLQAGARTLVTSLFEVPDAETRDLMQCFYKGVSAGKGKLLALHEAQVGMIEARRKVNGAAHPFFWASFVLVGASD